MEGVELHPLVLTDEDFVEAGYRATPYDKSGNYVGAPKVSDEYLMG